MDLTPISHMSDRQKINLARHLNTSEEELRELSTGNKYSVRYRVARNPNTPEDVLMYLAKDRNIDVRCAVATHPNITEEILRYLIKDTYYGARQRVAYHPKTSSKLLVALFIYEKSLKIPEAIVIRKLYDNEKLPLFAKRVIETLYGDWL